MQHKLNDFSASLLVASIEESLREFWSNWGRAPQSELYDDRNMLRLFTGVPYPFCNGVILSQQSPSDLGKIIDETVAYYSLRNARWEWIVGPSSSPANLENLLVKHGLSFHGEAIGMAVHLDLLSQDIHLTDHLEIIPVGDEQTLKLWATTMIDGFESPGLYPTFVDLECSLGCHEWSYRRYLGALDGQPVSTCALFLGKNVAGIYCVSTLPKARRMGIGAAITQHVLQEAHALGYHVAVLQSTQMGRSVYQQLGFQEFSTLRFYYPAR